MHRVLEEIKRETAEMIATQAQERGLSVDDYIRSLLPSGNRSSKATPLHARATPAELALAYGEWAAGHDRNTPVVLDDSRESIYEDEDR